MEIPLRKCMNKIIFIFLFFLFALEIRANENLSVEQKNIKDILLDISEKIESLEKIFLLPENGFIEDGDASIALVELDKLRVKLKNLEGEIEKIEYNLTSQLGHINKNLEKISIQLKKNDNSFGLGKHNIIPSINKKNDNNEKIDLSQLNDFQSLKRAKIYLKNSQFDNAKAIFNYFVKNFPNSTLLPEVFFYFAETYYNTNDWKLAANSYLESFSLDPKGDFAPQALFGLASSLGALKELDQACLILEEVNLRFPGQKMVSAENIMETKKLFSCY